LIFFSDLMAREANPQSSDNRAREVCGRRACWTSQVPSQTPRPDIVFIRRAIGPRDIGGSRRIAGKNAGDGATEGSLAGAKQPTSKNQTVAGATATLFGVAHDDCF
jgi:hypothetical protein